jgi:hypothetical protein
VTDGNFVALRAEGSPLLSQKPALDAILGDFHTADTLTPPPDLTASSHLLDLRVAVVPQISVCAVPDTARPGDGRRSAAHCCSSSAVLLSP